MSKKIKTRSALKSVCLGVSLLVAGGSIANAATVSLSPSALDVSPLDAFSVDIIGTDFATNFDGGSLDLFFDPSILQVDNVTINAAPWEFVAVTGTTDNVAGSITGMEFATFFGAGTDFTFATIDFTAISAGDSFLDIEKHVSFNFPDFSAGGVPYSVMLTDGSVSVSSVPLPAAGWLMLSGLAGLIGVSHRKSM